MCTTRMSVFHVISHERDYQTKRWGDDGHEGHKPVPMFLLYMQHYLAEATTFVTKQGDTSEGALHAVRKIAALAVACMEHNGAPKRED